MGKIFTLFLDDSKDKVYQCVNCHTHLTRRKDVMSKTFQGREGPAFLVAHVTNVTFCPVETRILMTGRHIVADAQCVMCGQTIGWKYIEAFQESQKYKEGKFIVERCKIIRGPPRAA